MEPGTEVFIPEFTELYPTYDAKENKSSVKGSYYIYSDKVRNGRIRITDSIDKVGKPCMITGWVSITALVRATNINIK